MADKVAIVTGGGSGIGRAVTHGLVDDGYHVLIAGRREDRLVETKSGARDPGKVSVVAADISTVEGVQAVFDSLTSAIGTPTPPRTRPRSTRSPGSPGRRRWTAAGSTSPADRSTSATP